MHPALFSLGPLQFHSYGLMVAVGVFWAIVFLRSHARDVKLDPDSIVDLALVTLMAGFVGARIFYVVEFWNYYRDSWWDAVKIWQGGIVIYGGLVGGFVGFFLYIRLKHLSFLSLLDLFMPAVALAQGFGRIGCFLNGCCYGIKSACLLAVKFPFLDHRVHPTQLYESFFCFVLFFVLFGLWRNRGCYPKGQVTLAYFAFYAVGRFVIEFFRGDNAKLLFGFTVAQWISVVVFVVSGLFFLVSFGYGRKNIRHPA